MVVVVVKSVMLMVVLTGCFGADVLADAMAVLVGCLDWCFDWCLVWCDGCKWLMCLFSLFLVFV